MIIFGLSDPGKVRELNEDAILYSFFPTGECAAVLADGLGGRSAGEIASDMATRKFLDYIKDGLAQQYPDIYSLASHAINYANYCVFKKARSAPEFNGMCTTFVAVIVRGNEAAVISVGDSRCYWFADGKLQQITKDHSYVQDLIDRGELLAENALHHPKKNLITRALGVGCSVESDVYRLDLFEGDKILICSDGLTNTVSDSEIAGILCSYDPREAVEQMITCALRRSAPDNVSAVVIQFDGKEGKT